MSTELNFSNCCAAELAQPRGRATNGLITCFFTTKWIKLWPQHEPASGHKNLLFLPPEIGLQQNTGMEKNCWLLFYASFDGFNSWLLKPENQQSNAMGNQRVISLCLWNEANSEACELSGASLLWDSRLPPWVRSLTMNNEHRDVRSCTVQWKALAFKSSNAPGWLEINESVSFSAKWLQQS